MHKVRSCAQGHYMDPQTAVLVAVQPGLHDARDDSFTQVTSAGKHTY